MYFNTCAIILASEPIGEYDYLVDVCSGQFGLLRLKLSGARRPGGRLKIFKEAAHFVDLQLYGRLSSEQNFSLKILTGRVLESFASVRLAPQSLAIALAVLDFTKLFLVPFDQRSQEKLELLLETLGYLSFSLTIHSLQALILVYKLKVLRLSGWSFVASDLAQSALDPELKEKLRLLEEGSFESPMGTVPLEKFNRILELHVQKIVSS